MGWVSTLISRRTFRAWGLVAILVVATAAIAGGIATGATATCDNPNVASIQTLPGSSFEIDTDANLKVDDPDCIDWLTGNESSGFRPGVDWKLDTPSGSGDGSFGEGTKEDTATPTIVNGSIPPNKSDLKAFGLYPEDLAGTDGTLALFWSRVQDPSGTTNMDFELNQKFCNPAATPTNCSGNGVTPVRTGNGQGTAGADDILITYDLSRGGTQATISVRYWTGSAWGPANPIANQTGALGTINSSTIGTSPIGSLDPRTFGEAAVTFDALFGDNQCGSIGSAYLKSRSSDSFTAALKDFVPPEQVNISNCPAALTTETSDDVTLGSNPAPTLTDNANLTVQDGTDGSIQFRLYGPFATAPSATDCTADKLISGAGSTVTVTDHTSASNPYESTAYTPTAAGYYNWTAQFTSSTPGVDSTTEVGCGDAAEQSQVNQAEPAIVTEAQTPVTVGATINDTATLSGGVSPTGTITFKLYASQADCENDANALFEDSVDVDNGNADYTSGNYTTTTVGNFFWKASYSGDDNNSAVSGVCGEDGETSVVGKAPSTLNTEQAFYPNDTATVTATDGGPPSGDVTFSLFNNSDCTGTPLYGPVSDDLDANGEASTNNTSFAVSTSGTLYWKVEYEGDNSHNPVSSCSENTELAINNGGPTTSQ
jgi:hypothetical protein